MNNFVKKEIIFVKKYLKNIRSYELCIPMRHTFIWNHFNILGTKMWLWALLSGKKSGMVIAKVTKSWTIFLRENNIFIVFFRNDSISLDLINNMNRNVIHSYCLYYQVMFGTLLTCWMCHPRMIGKLGFTFYLHDIETVHGPTWQWLNWTEKSCAKNKSLLRKTLNND